MHEQKALLLTSGHSLVESQVLDQLRLVQNGKGEPTAKKTA